MCLETVDGASPSNSTIWQTQSSLRPERHQDSHPILVGQGLNNCHQSAHVGHRQYILRFAI